MKKLVVSLLCAALLLFCACGGTERAADVSLKELQGELIGRLGVADPIVLNDEYIYIYFGVEPEAYTEAAAFMISRSVFPSEIVMFRAADENALSEITAALEAHLESLREQARDYDPESSAIAEKCTVVTDGLYCCFFFDGQREALEECFASHMKDYAPDQLPVYEAEPAEAPAEAAPAAEKPEAADETETAPAEEISEEVIETEEAEPLPFGLVPERQRVPDSWFDDAVIIGNSVAKNLQTYVLKQRMGSDPDCMGKAQFFTVGRFSYRGAALGIAPLPVYEGKNSTPADIAELSGAAKVYLVLPHIDLVFQHQTIEDTIGWAAQVMQELHERAPEAVVYICSMSPRSALNEHHAFNNENILAFNELLLQTCIDNGCYYVDCFTPLATEDNKLVEDYCVEHDDGGIHLNDAGCQVWMDWLYTHTAP